MSCNDLKIAMKKIDRKRQLTVCATACAVSLAMATSLFAQIAPGQDVYDASPQTITIDGDVSEWNASFIGPIQFNSILPAGALVDFQEWDGGVWTGPDDHTSTFAFAWDANALYLGIVVTDDDHFARNPGQPWNGDGVEMEIFDTSDDSTIGGYNVSLLGEDGALGALDSSFNPANPGPGVSDFAITRVGTTTTYEIELDLASLVHAGPLAVGQQFGFAFAVDDGQDTPAGQSNQKGWDGWGPGAAILGGRDLGGTVNLVPEPASLALFSFGLAALVAVRRRRVA